MADTGRTVWANGLWADGFWAAGLWAGGGTTSGVVPGFFKRTERTFLVEIDGNRFRVPESEIHRFIEDKQEEIVEQVINKPVKKKAKKQKQEKIPQLVVQTDDGWLRGLIKEANRVVIERIKLQREADDEDDVESILLFM